MKKAAVLIWMLLIFVIPLTACQLDKTDQNDTFFEQSENIDPPTKETSFETEPEAEAEPETEPHVHLWGDWIDITDATCTGKGSKERVCSCGGKQSQTVAALGHDYKKGSVVPPTEIEEGYTVYTCGICQSEKRDDYIQAGSIGLTYQVHSNSKTCTVTGLGSCKDVDVKIPRTFEGNTVTAIADRAFSGKALIESVEIPETVKTVGVYVFSGCDKLNTVYYNSSYAPTKNTVFLNLPSLKTVVFCGSVIPAYICYGCENIEEVIFSENVHTIDSHAFYGTGLTELNMPVGLKTLGGYSFYESSLKKMHIDNLAAWCEMDIVGDNAFPYNADFSLYWNGEPLSVLSVPEGVKKIGSRVFEGQNLASVTIPDSVTSIGDFAFCECKLLTNVQMGQGVKAVGYGAFSECDALTAITLFDGVVTIDGYAFYGCDSLKSIALADSITDIGDNTFARCISLESCTLPSALQKVENRLFRECSSLKRVVIGENVTEIASDAFWYCTALQNVDFSKAQQLKTIGYSAFNCCFSLTEIVLPNSLITIDALAFQHCFLLETVRFGSNLKEIGGSAFSNCDALKELTIPNSVTTIGDSAFSSCAALEWIILPSGLTTVSERLFSHCSVLESVTLPNSLVTIEKNAFYECEALKSISFPSTLSKIGDYAFCKCKLLQEILLPNGLQSIGTSAFSGCESLTEIQITDSVTVMGNSCFSGCFSLQRAVLGNGLKVLEKSIFSNCGKLTEVIVSKTVKKIPTSVFYSCNQLASVYYCGSEEEWGRIGDVNFDSPLRSAVKYYYSEQQPLQDGNYWRFIDGIPTKW